jgi:putative redox protein
MEPVSMTDDWKEVVARWVGESAFTGFNPAGGSVQMGSYQGQPGISPMEMLLLGVAGCTGMDIVSILGKKRQILTQFEVQVRGRRAEAHPRVYTEIEVIYHFWGDHIDQQAVEQAIQLSQDKYCSVSAMLSAVANFNTQYFIHSVEETSLVV